MQAKSQNLHKTRNSEDERRVKVKAKVNTDAIRARLGSISDKKMQELPKAVQKLLKEDLPSLLQSDKWLNVDEIAIHLGISKVTVYRMIEDKTLPVYRVGRLWRAKARDLDQWVVSGRKQ